MALGVADVSFRNIGESSGGQRQLASLAPTLARELMAEPASALNLWRQAEVLGLMRELARARCIVVLIDLRP